MSQTPDTRAAFLGLRHHLPDTVRRMRLALDNGVDPKQIVSATKKRMPEHVSLVTAALVYMTENRQAGLVHWISNEQWNWREETDAQTE